MAERDVAASVQCPRCDQSVHETQLRTCQMCRIVVCQLCEVMGYGRAFCSIQCRDIFFFGEAEEFFDDEQELERDS